MKQLAELIPLVLFFVVYQLKGEQIELFGWEHQFDGIFSATAVLIMATVAQVLFAWASSGKVEKRQLWLLAAVSVFGGATLIFRDQTFIQWKPTIFNWGLAIVFLGSQFIGKRTLMERTLGSQLQLPKAVWTRLNLLWAGNFALVGSLNLYVAFNYPMDF